MIYAPPGSAQTVATVDVDPKEAHRFCLNDADIEQLTLQAIKIEQHYGCPMDVEWAKDGIDGELYILQARPETVQSQAHSQKLERYQLKQKGKVIVSGRSIGQKIGSGVARVLSSISEMDRIKPGDILVTDMTDPDWEPIMKKAAAIVTNRGGRTCHAAIIARELGVPAIVGCGDATSVIRENDSITVSCAEGETGLVYQGLLDFDVVNLYLDQMPELPFKMMLNVANPDRVFNFRQLPNAGVGLARMEFIINQMIGIHPQALLGYADLEASLKEQIRLQTQAYASPVEYYIERLKEGISTIAAAFHPKPVIVRMSDFKSNEYAHLLGGQAFEPDEDNPMLGFRGAVRYVSKSFKDCFALECEAIKRVRNDMGLTNVQVMIPFVRTLTEAQQVIDLLAEHGLSRAQNELKIIMMCEVPSNAILAEQFLELFDGFSIGSNDLTQLTLGLDRDSALVAELFNERDPAVKALLHRVITVCRQAGKYIGICGQGPSDYPDFAQWLMNEGIESMSLNPDSVLETWLYLAKQSLESQHDTVA